MRVTILCNSSLIVRNNHYHGIVESVHARLGGLIEGVTEKDVLVYIQPHQDSFHYIRKYQAENCNLQLIEESRSSLQKYPIFKYDNIYYIISMIAVYLTIEEKRRRTTS